MKIIENFFCWHVVNKEKKTLNVETNSVFASDCGPILIKIKYTKK